jgi:hypothetical protein
MSLADTESAAAQVAGWLGEGSATWGQRLPGGWAEYQLPAGPHSPALLDVLEHRPVPALPAVRPAS